ncbi:LysE family translocator [Nocardioides bizhenqiangii]|uniref:LysE family translocator n=1 Tax=Nocardioides bizhenqiangii TaxID=3095076 RepID=A0ABZ0ZLY7_9ACTN|nr:MULTISPECIES: LysE family translocator [unclassified Nocardioides]MDZ5620973.1 LysE family translocator [Nocardioides sp. HM23]WQQ25332.1 LysE family translocator [Nocardioides sp. HM61]
MLTFAIASLVLIMMPGPDQALVTRNALVGGRAGGLLTALGGMLGTTVHAGAAALGLSALLVTSATAFTALKIVGVVYLLWLALSMLASSRRPQGEDATPPVETQVAWKYLRHGFLSNALNPKVALFFVTFLPQFLSSSTESPRAEALLLSAVFALLYISWFGLYATAVERLGHWLRQPKVSARIEQLTGIGLIAVAARLATSSH